MHRNFGDISPFRPVEYAPDLVDEAVYVISDWRLDRHLAI